jgi:tetratricopeptide (TPR) repeat protein
MRVYCGLKIKEISLIVLKIMIVVGVLMQVACTTSSNPEGGLGEMPETEVVETGALSTEAKKTAIDPDVLFLLMTAEIAGQRGQYGLALDGYLRAAKRVNNVDVSKRAAKIALYLQDESRLKQSLDLWMQMEPDSLEARQLMAVAALKSGDRQAAYANIEYILQGDSEGFEANSLVILKSLPDSTSQHLAKQVFADLSAKYSENAQLYFLQALIEVRQKRPDAAQAQISKALERDPSWVKALVLQSQLYVGRQKLAEATEVLQRAVAEQENARISEQIAQLLIQQQRYDETKQVLRRLITQYPENNELKFKLALVHLQAKETTKARVILESLITEKVFRDRAAFYLGRMDAKEKNYDAAIIWFDAVRDAPYKFEANMSAILLLMDQSRSQDALIRVGRLKAEFPEKKSELALLESEIYAQLDDYQQAFDLLTSALLVDSDNKKILYARALIAEKLGKLQVLEDDLKYILEKTPDDASVLNALGYTLADKTNRYQEAQKYLKKAIALKPNEPVIIDSYGWLLFKQNKLAMAREYLLRAYAAEPQAEIAAHLVDVLWALGDKQGAETILREALAKYPDDELLLEVEVRLLGNK